MKESKVAPDFHDPRNGLIHKGYRNKNEN